jgi:hypothetical protein
MANRKRRLDDLESDLDAEDRRPPHRGLWAVLNAQYGSGKMKPRPKNYRGWLKEFIRELYGEQGETS